MLQSKDSLILGQQTVYFKSSEKMEEIAANSIDVIITSPPYNRNKHYSSDAEEAHNDNLPLIDYLEFLKRVWRECYRVASEKCVFFLNIGDSASDQGLSEKVAESAVECGWVRIQDLIWVKSIYGKGHYTPSGGNKRFNNVWEHIFLFVKNPKEYLLDPKAVGIPYADKSNIGRYGDEDLRDPGNVIHICYEKTTGANIKKGHDAPFPIGLPYFCIKAVPNPSRILDPFLGTGTTLAAAFSLGIEGVGYEMYPRVDLINQTILEGKGYAPEPIILIPHYEESIEILLKYMEKLFKFISNVDLGRKEELLSLLTPKTKKANDENVILLDTLKKMHVKSFWIDIIDQLLNSNLDLKSNSLINSFPKKKNKSEKSTN